MIEAIPNERSVRFKMGDFFLAFYDRTGLSVPLDVKKDTYAVGHLLSARCLIQLTKPLKVHRDGPRQAGFGYTEAKRQVHVHGRRPRRDLNGFMDREGHISHSTLHSSDNQHGDALFLRHWSKDRRHLSRGER
jgi:hypothetical protein